MAVSAVFMLDGKGKLLISRDFRGDVPVTCVDRFVNIITGECGAGACAPACVTWADAALSAAAAPRRRRHGGGNQAHHSRGGHNVRLRFVQQPVPAGGVTHQRERHGHAVLPAPPGGRVQVLL